MRTLDRILAAVQERLAKARAVIAEYEARKAQAQTPENPAPTSAPTDPPAEGV